MHGRIFTLFLAVTVIVGSAMQLSALQSSAAQANSPQNKSAQATTTQSASADDPTKKLGAFTGKWETEGVFTNGPKTSTTLECRWSPQGSYLVCDQLVHMGAGGDHRQFTVYSYDSKAGKYSFTTLADPGAKPTTGGITIKGNLWTYDDSSFTGNGKTTLVRVTNEFTDPKTEVFKVTSSEDNGANWKIMLQGVAHKVVD
ncbi:MAG: hypothetical protein WA672_13040 [Candidatus Angelobacter sp.]